MLDERHELDVMGKKCLRNFCRDNRWVECRNDEMRRRVGVREKEFNDRTGVNGPSEHKCLRYKRGDLH